MATHTWVDLDIPEAQMLQDLTGIKVDLERARDTALQLDKVRAAEKPDWSLVEPLSVAAAVAYSRSFMTGVRSRLDEDDLTAFSPQHREAHEHLRAYRDKHVAHSVNAYENNNARAQYCIERVKEEGITAVGCSHGRVLSLSSGDTSSIIQLTAILIEHVERRIKAEQARLLEIVRQMPLGEVLAGGQGSFRIDHTKSIDQRRKKG